MGFFAHFRGCKFQDAEWQVDSREDTQIDGRSTRLGTDGSQKQRPAYNLEIRRREDDRTAWGSYMESAPPVLPADTCIPGFEDEILLAARGQYSECNSDDGNSKDESGEGLDDDGGRRNANGPCSTRRCWCPCRRRPQPASPFVWSALPSAFIRDARKRDGRSLR